MRRQPYLVRFADNLPSDTIDGFRLELEQIGVLLPYAVDEWEIVVQREPELAQLKKLFSRWEKEQLATWRTYPT